MTYKEFKQFYNPKYTWLRYVQALALADRWQATVDAYHSNIKEAYMIESEAAYHALINNAALS